MAKLVALLLLVFLCFSMLHTMCVVEGKHHKSHGHHKGHDGSHGDGRDHDRTGNLKASECPSECARRCSKTHHRKPCMFFCQKCCSKCFCVPPGTYGNKADCPCYNNWKTKEGGPKCP